MLVHHNLKVIRRVRSCAHTGQRNRVRDPWSDDIVLHYGDQNPVRGTCPGEGTKSAPATDRYSAAAIAGNYDRWSSYVKNHLLERHRTGPTADLDPDDHRDRARTAAAVTRSKP